MFAIFLYRHASNPNEAEFLEQTISGSGMVFFGDHKQFFTFNFSERIAFAVVFRFSSSGSDMRRPNKMPVLGMHGVVLSLLHRLRR